MRGDPQLAMNQHKHPYLLSGLGILTLITGLLINFFLKEAYCPLYLYLPIAAFPLLLSLGYFRIAHIQEHFKDYASFAHLFIYLGIVYISFRNAFEPHFMLLMITAHIMFALSFRTLAEFSLFAISSIALLMLCVYLTVNSYLDPYLFVSVVTLVTTGIGVYIWSQEGELKTQEENNELLYWLLNRNNEALVILSVDCQRILFQNKMARQIFGPLFHGKDPAAEQLLEALGLSRSFMIHRFKAGTYPVPQEQCFCGLNHPDGRKLALELFITTLKIREENGILIRIRDISPKSGAWLAPLKEDANLKDLPQAPTTDGLQEIDVPGLIELIIENIKLQIQPRLVHFRVEVDRVPKVMADIQLLAIVLKQLIMLRLPEEEVYSQETEVDLKVRNAQDFITFVISLPHTGHYTTSLTQGTDNKNGSISLPAEVKDAISQLQGTLRVSGPHSNKTYTFSLPVKPDLVGKVQVSPSL